MENQIKIACTGAGVEDYRELVDLHGNLKERTSEDIISVMTFLKKYGWSYPFFVWNDNGTKYVFDWQGNLPALAEFEGQGWDIPPLPAVYIFADDLQEAKIKLLKLNARYGSLTKAGYDIFTSGMDSVDLDGVIIRFDVPKKIEVDTIDYTENLDAITQYGDVEITIPCPECIHDSSYSIKELLGLMGE